MLIFCMLLSFQLIAGEKKAKFGEIPTTFEPPKGLFDSKEDQLKQYWTWTE